MKTIADVEKQINEVRDLLISHIKAVNAVNKVLLSVLETQKRINKRNKK